MTGSLVEIYRRIKEARDEELLRILAILRPKALSDPEIGEAVRLLECWSAGGESRQHSINSAGSEADGKTRPS